MPMSPSGPASLKPRVIVTRPAPDAGRWVSELARHGWQAEALPLIEIAPVADLQPLQAVWRTLDRYAALMFVSGNAVEHFFASNQPEAPVKPAQAATKNIAIPVFPDVRCMAPGPGTVSALRAAGVPAQQIDAPAPDASQFDSAALWRVVGPRPWQGRRVLIVRGQSVGAAGDATAIGRDWLARQWQAAGAQVDFLTVYQRRAPVLTAQQRQRAEAASHDGTVWLFSSSEAVTHLASLPGLDWSQARAVATHPRIAQTVRAAGWGVVVESRPALTDILASIESMQP